MHAKANQKMTNTAKLKDCFVDGTAMICCKSSFIMQSYHFATDLDRVLLQLVNILFKDGWAADIHH